MNARTHLINATASAGSVGSDVLPTSGRGLAPPRDGRSSRGLLIQHRSRFFVKTVVLEIGSSIARPTNPPKQEVAIELLHRRSVGH